MMLDINIERVRQGFWKNLPLGALVGGLMAVEMSMVLSGRYFGLANLPPQNLPANYSNTKELARLLYTDYAYPFEIASVILLVAIIAAVMLTLRTRKDNKAMHASDQIAVKSKDRMRLVKMAPEVEVSVPTAKEGEQA
jgi:NADH-quinone oxidoreductase subunit J